MKMQKTIEVMYKKYKKILKVNIGSEELNELYHEYISERADIP